MTKLRAWRSTDRTTPCIRRERMELASVGAEIATKGSSTRKVLSNFLKPLVGIVVRISMSNAWRGLDCAAVVFRLLVSAMKHPVKSRKHQKREEC